MTLRRAAKRTALASAAAICFGATFLGSLGLHGNLPVTRRLVARVASGLLATVFLGKIVVEEIDHVGLDGVTVKRASVLDPTGRRVIQATGIHVRVPLGRLAEQLFLRPATGLLLSFDDVTIDEADADLDRDASGELRIVTAFTPKKGPPAAPTAPKKPTRIHVAIPNVHIRHGWAHGEPATGLPIDAHGDDIPASVDVDTGDAVRVDVAPVALRGRLLSPLDPRGVGEYHLFVPLAPGSKAVMTARFAGVAGEAPIVASARIEGGLLHAELDAAHLTPAQLASLVPGAKVASAFSLHATADGPFHALQIAARAIAGPSEIDLEGQLRVGVNIAADVDLRVRDLDPRVLSETAPSASVGGDVHAHLELTPTGLLADLDASSFPLTIAGQAIPGATFKGRYEAGALRGTALVFEPGAPATVKLSVDAAGAVEFEATVAARSLAAVPRLARALDGSVRATVKGRIERGSLDARVDATLGGVGHGATRIGSGALRGRLSGPLAKLVIDTAIDGRQVSIGGVLVERGRGRVAGPLRSPHVTLTLDDPRWTELRVDADIDTRGGLSANNVHGSFAKDNLRTEVKARGLELGRGGVTLRGLDLRGDSGDLSGSLAITDAGVVADLEGTLDLAKAARLVPQLPLSGGSARFSLHTKVDERRRGGHLEIHVEGAEVALLPFRVFADATADLDGTSVTADASARILGSDAELGDFHARATGKLPGSLLSGAAWSKVTGDATLDRGTIHLGGVRHDAFVKTALLALPSTPEIAGELEIGATIGRDTDEGIDRVSVRVDTDGLTLTPVDARDVAKRTWAGYDVHATFGAVRAADASRERGERERMSVGVTAQVSDPESAPLATLTALTTTTLQKLFADFSTVIAGSEGAEAARARLAALPIDARASWAFRPISAWPAPIRPSHLAGTVSVSAALKGTLREPEASATLTAMGLSTAIPGADTWPADVVLTANLTGDHADLVGRLAHDGAPLAEGKITAQASIPAMLWGQADRHAWTADAELDFAKMPLEAVPILAANGASGKLTGSLHATGIHARPIIDLDLMLEGAKILDSPLKRGHLVGRITGGGDAVTVTLEQEPSSYAPDGGLLRVTVLPSIAFTHGLVPRLDETRGQTAAIQLRRFDVEPFAPFVSRFLADLRGYVDGEATLTVGAKTASGERATKLWGKLALREAVVLVPQLGQTFSRGTVDVTTEDAPGVTRVIAKDLAFTATSGRVTGSAYLDIPTDRIVSTLFGAAGGDAPTKATGRATIGIDPSEKIPVTFEGVPLGDASGRVDASVAADSRDVDFVVAIPELAFELPETDSRGVQSLADAPDIGVMDKQYRLGKKRRAEGAVRVSVVVGIGDTLEEIETNADHSSGRVLVRRSGLDVRLRGRPRVELTDTLRVDGIVETLSGRVLALGKPFNVERGFVRFEGDTPDNPSLALRASWDSPEGSRVYAELVGHLREAKITLRSEPPRPESEVLSLILFGRDQSAVQTLPGAQTSDAGVAAGSGVASTVLNTLLDPVQVFGHRIETRVDTTTARGTAIGVATEIRPNLWAQVDVSTAQQQQRQTQDVSAVTLDWRFRKAWSLRTTVGDRGSSTVEVVWQYRY